MTAPLTSRLAHVRIIGGLGKRDTVRIASGTRRIIETQFSFSVASPECGVHAVSIHECMSLARTYVSLDSNTIFLTCSR